MRLNQFFKNKRILLTGACGTVCKEIARQLIYLEPEELRLIDNNETGIFFLREEFKDKNVICYLGDVRDKEKIKMVSRGIDIIIHCAALKHVILSEYNPFDIVQTNIIGVQNIIQAATVSNVKYVIFTSSDKAVNPTNVMGASKLMGEKLMTAANTIKFNNDAIFASVRFGNVIGSRGSVVPLFMQQIKKGGPVTVTDRRMTRFIMTIEQSAQLILKALSLAKGGEVFVLKMPVVNVYDLAEVLIELLAPRYGYKPSNIKIVEIGAKPGEKLYEELLNEEEKNRTIELKDLFVILPAFRAIYQSIRYDYPDIISNKIDKVYISANETPLTKGALKEYLLKNKVLERTEKSLYHGI